MPPLGLSKSHMSLHLFGKKSNHFLSELVRNRKYE